MSIPVTTDEEFVLLTDRWGNANDIDLIENGPKTLDTDAPAVAKLVSHMQDENTFVARRLSDDAYGLVVEGAEWSHDGIGGDKAEMAEEYRGETVNGTAYDGSSVPPLRDVLADLSATAELLKERWPDLDIQVVHGAPVFEDRAMMRAFVPETSPLMADLPEIARTIQSPPEPAPAPGM